MTFWAIISSVFATLFGGLNIFQWITLRSYKRLRAAEADRSEIENLRTIIAQNQAEIGRLQQRLDAYEKRDIAMQTRYDELYTKYDHLRDEFEEYKLNHK